MQASQSQHSSQNAAQRKGSDATSSRASEKGQIQNGNNSRPGSSNQIKQSNFNNSNTFGNSKAKPKQRETYYSQLNNDPRFYKEDFVSTKKVTQCKTSYNFLNEHSDDIQHNINPQKAVARMTDSNIGKRAKFDEDNSVLSGSPKKKHNQRDQFINQSEDGYSPIKTVSQHKVRELVGTNPVNPLTKEQLQDQMRDTYGSPDKQNRVTGYMNSTGMIGSLQSVDNDPSFSVLGTKPQNRGYVPPENLKKETWKPKTSLQWNEPYRAPLTLQ
ncbi:UNKNOWN [Stylonychia lemnae]|uniref:Uncharacterized protein n=1 Tax=Stylonychia lemnae TaxID=5949 RepID=A0A077ZQR0_STYLE|nr:UNKNOWN [Stylonychia lemnae]|eukprot:CDW71784.1 UNKNOWN [Stylonychia lemnae]